MNFYKKFLYIFISTTLFFTFSNASFWLELGVGYPPVQSKIDVDKSVDKINKIWTKDIRIIESWELREPQKDTYNWDALEYRINSFYNNWTRILLMLDESWPSWTNSTWSHLEQETLDEFREYVKILLQKYWDKIYWIWYWNEWNWSLDEKFGWSIDWYVAYQNIIYEEVKKMKSYNVPYVVLGSYSGLPYIAYDEWLIHDYKMQGKDVDQAEFNRYAKLSAEKRESVRVKEFLSKAKYDVLNVHLYDTYYQWAAYVKAFQNINVEVKWRKYPVVVTEFWWPYPQYHYNKFWKPSQEVIATSLVNQIIVLTKIPDVKIAYYFKLTETEEKTMAHPDNYLFYLNDNTTYSFYIYKEAIKILKQYKY